MPLASSKVDQLKHTYTYHPTKKENIGYFELLRENAKELALNIESSCPDSQEKSMAQTKLQEVIMWANAAIALHG